MKNTMKSDNSSTKQLIADLKPLRTAEVKGGLISLKLMCGYIWSWMGGGGGDDSGGGGNAVAGVRG